MVFTQQRLNFLHVRFREIGVFLRGNGSRNTGGFTRGIDEIVGLKGHLAALAHDRHGLNVVTIALGTQQVGVEQHIYAALFGHLVKNEL